MFIIDESIKSMCLNSCKEVNEIINPILSILKINGFSFHRIYKDNSRIFLTNSDSWADNYFRKNYFSIQEYNKFKSIPMYLPWNIWPKEDQKACELISDAYNNFNYGNSLSIHKNKKDYIDIFSLRSSTNDTDAICRYFTELETINNYLDYFLLRYESQISKLEKIKIVQKNNNPNIKDSNLDKLYDKHICKNGLIHPKTNKTFLTNREHECLILVIKGNSAKAIAKSLKISFRTVELHISHAKEKLCVSRKKDLIEKILSIEHNKYILLKELSLTKV